MSAPAVLSIVIAAYNAEATLADQFSALLAEPPPVAWEIVISDNGSSDSTSESSLSGRKPTPRFGWWTLQNDEGQPQHATSVSRQAPVVL